MSSHKTTPGWLFGITLIPVFFCMVAHVNGVTPQQCPEGTPRPALVFEQYAAERRELTHKDRPWVYYAFVNKSSEEVRMESVSPDCECVSIQFFKAGPQLKKVHQLTQEDEVKNYQGFALAPGAAYYILASIDGTSKQPGRHEFDIEVKYEDVISRKETLHFNVTLPEKKIVIEPEVVHITQNKAEEIKSSAWIADHRGNDLKIVSMRVNSDWFTAELGETEFDGIKRQEIVIKTTDQIPNDRVKGTVEVTTDDPDHPRIWIPVVIDGVQGKPKPFIAQRDSLHFKILPGQKESDEEGDAPKENIGYLVSLPQYAYTITDISASVDWIKVELQKPEVDEAGKQVHPVKVTLTPPEGAKTYREMVKLQLNDPEWPMLEIPIKIDVLPGEKFAE
ncbi:hypothetical protein Pla110_22710 [Polystyrenella longa]|uniref:DUF1573 domain-containing protein n=1 Tax=Polystyrenella longa TaxID=2528007 RepID=A0A518CMU3_9PLAN|nr:hypothetical protein [Polystyrenella longa]QDU80540.1 hypothetical protein Pla110_22710 [Polystyrenella longa]